MQSVAGSAVVLLLVVLAGGAAAQPLPMAEAIVRARQQSQLHAASRVRVEAAVRSEDLVNRLGNPVLELRSENWGSSSPGLPNDTFAIVTQPIELGGKLGARRAQQQAAVVGAQAAAAMTDRDVVWEVTRRYVDALRQRGPLATLREQRTGIAEMVRVLTVRCDEGTAAEADLRKFESEGGRVQTQIVRAEANLQLALARLTALVGGAIAAESLVLPALPDLVAASAGAPDVERRPEIAEARARLARAQSQLAFEKARGVPDLLVTGGYKRTAGMDTGVFAVAVPLPIFDSNRAARTVAQAEVQAAELELAYVRERARADASAQLNAARRLLEQATAVERVQAQPAGVVLIAPRTAFIEGAGDLLRLVDAQRIHAEALRDALDVRLDALLAYFVYRLLAGEEPLP
jgi:cobalt-zinc-cadmium efflux system outer membrane protein